MPDRTSVAAPPDHPVAPGGAATPYVRTVLGAESLWKAVQEHPLRFDAVLAAVIASVATVLNTLGNSGRSPSGGDAVVAGLTFLLLLTRRRAPLTVLALSLLGAATAVAADPATAHLLESTAMIALYTVTAEARPRRAVVATATAVGARPGPALRPVPPGMDRLTEREREVLGLVAGGLSNDDIAKRLYLSPYTAKTHVNRIMAKVGARDRAQLVVVAYQSGFAAI